MTVYVLDSSALIRYVDNEAGAARIEQILNACACWQAELCISAVQWGEVAGNLRQRFGASEEKRILSSLLPSEAKITPVIGERAARAADLKVDRKLAYADAFAIELTMDSPEHVLVTADFDFEAVSDLAQIEFLPAK